MAKVGQLRRVRNTVRLQAIVRTLVAQRRLRKFRRALVNLQCAWRCRVARKIIKALRIAAKDVGRLQQSNEALKAEIEALKARAAEENRRIQAEMLIQMEAAAKKAEVDDHKRLLDELEAARKELAEEKKKNVELQGLLDAAVEHKKHESLQSAAPGRSSFDVSKMSPSQRPVSPTTAGSNKKVAAAQSTRARGASNAQLSDDGTPDARPSSPRTTTQLEDALKRETAAREALEAEVNRLRGELQAEQQSRSTGNNSVSGEVKRRPDENPPRRGSGSSASAAQGAPARRGSHNRTGSARTMENWIETWDDESDGSGEQYMADRDASRSSNATEIGSGSGAPTKLRASFSEKVVPPMPTYNRSRADVLSPQQKVIQTRAAIDTFEKNLETFKLRLKEGMRVFVWDGKNAHVEALTKLTDGDVLTFSPPVRRFSLFSAKVDIKSIKIAEILECQGGADRQYAKDITDDSCVLTVVCQNSGGSSASPRVVVLLVDSRDERNSLLTGLRAMVSDIQMNATTTELLRTPDKPPPIPDTSSPDGYGETKAGVAKVRRPSFRATAIENSEAQAQAQAPVESSAPSIAQRRGSTSQDSLAASNSDLKREVFLEREKYERLMIQTLALTNDLNDREDQIIALKKREAALEENLKIRERMYAQDAQVRLQLGKRLEQVLMDKEEIKDELDSLKAHLDVIRNGFQNADK